MGQARKSRTNWGRIHPVNIHIIQAKADGVTLTQIRVGDHFEDRLRHRLGGRRPRNSGGSHGPICLACWPRYLAGTVCAFYSAPALFGLIVASGRVVIRAVVIALRTATSETPRCAA